MLVRDKCTGYYCPAVYCEFKSDIMSKFCLMVKRMRKDQTFSRLGYPVICHLTLDVAGEWSDATKGWTEMCADMGIRLSYASPDNKRAHSHGEAAVKHISHPAKSIMLNSSLPPMWIQECIDQAIVLRNNLPLSRDVVSKDGNTVRPLERMSGGLISRYQCDKTLQHTLPVGTMCLVFRPLTKNSDLTKPKAKWYMAIGQRNDLPIFWDPISGCTVRSKAYTTFPLPPGQNYETFYGKEMDEHAGSHLKSKKRRVNTPLASGPKVLSITNLSSSISPGVGLDTDILTYRGMTAPPVIVIDANTGE